MTLEHFGQAIDGRLGGPLERDRELLDGRLAGGFNAESQAAGADGASPRGVLVVIYSAKLEDTYAKVTAAGGKIVRETFEFPGGRRFHFADPNGNELAVWSE